MKTIEIQCRECRGKGLYVGFAEHDDCAVVCKSCAGTGRTTFSYEEFTGRKPSEGIVRVFADPCGYSHFSDDHYFPKDGTTIHYSQGGCTYEEWLAGAEPKPVKDLYCPHQWSQCAKGSNAAIDRCFEARFFSRFSDCQFYSDKATCWEVFNAQEAAT